MKVINDVMVMNQTYYVHAIHGFNEHKFGYKCFAEIPYMQYDMGPLFGRS